MNEITRKKVVLAMELLARCVNDEDVFESWLMGGVADGDIPLLSIDVSNVDDYYIEDRPFSELMACFLRVMSDANKSGGLYCDRVVSKRREHE